MQSEASAPGEDQEQLCRALGFENISTLFFFNQKYAFAASKHRYLLYCLVIVLGWRRENIIMDQNSLTCIYKQQLPFPGAQEGRINKYEMQNITTHSEAPKTRKCTGFMFCRAL